MKNNENVDHYKSEKKTRVNEKSQTANKVFLKWRLKDHVPYDYVYWSSSEYNYDTAWVQNFGSGIKGGINKNLSFHACAVRAF